MLIKDKIKYDSYIFLRPDLEILEKIDINYILSTSNNKNLIVTPYWHSGAKGKQLLTEFRFINV